jgi:hypothetical protein
VGSRAGGHFGIERCDEGTAPSIRELLGSPGSE